MRVLHSYRDGYASECHCQPASWDGPAETCSWCEARAEEREAMEPTDLDLDEWEDLEARTGCLQ